MPAEREAKPLWMAGGGVTRVAKGRNISVNFPWEIHLGNFGNIPSLKLKRNIWEFMGIHWKCRKIIKLYHIQT